MLSQRKNLDYIRRAWRRRVVMELLSSRSLFIIIILFLSAHTAFALFSPFAMTLLIQRREILRNQNVSGWQTSDVTILLLAFEEKSKYVVEHCSSAEQEMVNRSLWQCSAIDWWTIIQYIARSLEWHGKLSRSIEIWHRFFSSKLLFDENWLRLLEKSHCTLAFPLSFTFLLSF